MLRTTDDSLMSVMWILCKMRHEHHTRMNKPCHTYEWAMSHVWMSHVPLMKESCHSHTYERVMSHIWMSHVLHMSESCPTYECVMSHVWMSHVPHRCEKVILASLCALPDNELLALSWDMRCLMSVSTSRCLMSVSCRISRLMTDETHEIYSWLMPYDWVQILEIDSWLMSYISSTARHETWV